MTTIYDVLLRPIITEKSNYLSNKLHQYSFEVAPDATKSMVREAMESLFDVTVESVNVMNVPAKRGRRAKSRRLLVRSPGFRKAVITLAEGSTLEIFEGVK